MRSESVVATDVLRAQACGNAGCGCATSLERVHGLTHCPAHADRTPSLHVKEAKSGRLLVKCFAGCSQTKVIDDLTSRGLWPSRPKSNRTTRSSGHAASAPAARQRIWLIRNPATREVVAEHHRLDHGLGKKRMWWTRDGEKGLGGMQSADLPLYGAHELANLSPGATVIVTEGEPAADALREREFAAVATVTGAAGTPSPASLEALRGFDVVVWPDDDEQGSAHMARIAAAGNRLGFATRVLRWSPPVGASGVKPRDHGADAVDYFAAGGTVEELLPLLARAERIDAPQQRPTKEATAVRVEIPPEPPAFPSLGATLEAARAFNCRYVHFANAQQAIAVTLWEAHTHAVDAAECSPFLAITAAEMRSGKSRTLDVLSCLTARPWRAIVPSDAVLFRKIDRDRPTLLLDEADTIFGRKAGEYEGLRAILNAGNRRGTSVPRVVPEGKTMTLVEFSVFCPKAIAGIGTLPATVADRAIPIRMTRRARGERLEKFRERDAEALARPIREALAYHTAALLGGLRDSRPAVPDELDDRAQDSWEPLLAIADAAGGSWPAAARRAAVDLHASRDADDESLGVLLLHDVRRVFTERDTDRLTTADLLGELLRIEESPWADMRGRPLGPHGLARLLRSYDIAPRVLRIGSATPRGYTADSFADAFTRYLPPSSTAASTATPQQAAQSGHQLINRNGVSCDVAVVTASREREQQLGHDPVNDNDPAARMEIEL